ncbi:MAG: FHIPEP family type III secretion protein [Treponema sp.]|nr:FHIPEP family type III secretion protein [Treponema sp.]
MAVNKNLSGTLSYSSITLLILAVIMFPIPPRFTDFVILLNIVLSILLFIDVRLRKKDNDYSVFSNYLLYMAIFGLAINILVTRQILSLGEHFNSMLIIFIASPLSESGTVIITAILIIFITCVIFVFFKYVNKICSISGISAGSCLDSRHEKITAVDSEYQIRSITEEEADKRKASIQEKVDFYESFNESAGFFSNCEKFRFLLIIINAVTGIIIGTRIKGDSITDAYQFYVSLVISSGFYALIPVFFLAFSAKIVLLQKSENESTITS